MFNWLVNAASLHYSILPKFGLGVYCQVASSLAEVIFVLYTGMHVLFEAEIVEWWYWPVLLGAVLWCFLSNTGFSILLYGGSSRSSSTGSDLQRYSLLEDMHGERDSMSTLEMTEEHISLSVFFLWFSEVLEVGSLGALSIEDLPPLPSSMGGMYMHVFQHCCS
jgi:hypothetical protein